MKASFDLAAIRLACTGGLAFSRTESRNIRAAVQTMNEAAFGRTPVSCSETMSPATADNSCHAGVSEVMRRSKLRLMQHEYSGALVGFEQALKVVERDCVADDFQAGLILLDMGGTDHLLQSKRCG